MMTSAQIRQSFLDFFAEKQHTIVPSSSLMPDAPNLLFTNAGMNQFVPIFLGEMACPYKPARAADTQKCIRAGGKHNDLEDVGLDTYHHTFFEMLGNWSFGNYFKKEAIEWAWELVVDRWKFPTNRLYATVYSPDKSKNDPADFDQEAYDVWAKLFISAGLDPKVHIVNGNKKDNFWMMGDTGPCGPCSELHVDLTPEGDTKGSLVNQGDARCIEIWNLVFIQYNANGDGTYVPLPSKHVDTGMGFERACSIIQDTKNFTDFKNAQISNYNTDVFSPIFTEIEKLCGLKYTRTLPAGGLVGLRGQERIDVAFRVLADHIRTLSCSIADGILPGNDGRNYVLRRILRRAVLWGRALNLNEPFFHKLVPVVAQTLGDIFPELRKNEALITKVIHGEEESFNRTLDIGLELFSKDITDSILNQAKIEGLTAKYDLQISRVLDGKILHAASGVNGKELLDIIFGKNAVEIFARYFKSAPILSGADTFKLYDTYGFPLDMTEMLARGFGISVDTVGFEKLMEEQRARSKASQKKEKITVSGEDENVIKAEFVGYDTKQNVPVQVCNYVLDMPEAGDEDDTVRARLYFTPTPFYAEMGGQVGDIGTITFSNDFSIRIIDTVRSGTHGIAHITEDVGLLDHIDFPLTASIDLNHRAQIEAHHSATHILHWALREVLGTMVRQKGSYVGPDRLRFDFAHIEAMKPQEIRTVEAMVNEKIIANDKVSWQERPYSEVKGDASIMQFFGDKYGETVRVVDIGGYSKELCAGTHVNQTGQIGSFRIIHEGAIAAGIRRIEALSGKALCSWLAPQIEKQQALFLDLSNRKPDIPKLPAYTGDVFDAEALWQSYVTRKELLEKIETELREWEKEQAKQKQVELQRTLTANVPVWITGAQSVNNIPFITRNLGEVESAILPLAVGELKKHWQGVAVLACHANGKVGIIASISPEFTKQIQAGKIIQQIAPLVGGKGGGKPDLAQGGGTQAGKIDEALAAAKKLLG
ncbi:MAG: alanine--tRNA ligase [Verrucomicrobiales bacterium]|jgi:alanyl-tRNA synthetase|nr:alanine--tRNA ligase [Verrucomicrobiales bacterium]